MSHPDIVQSALGDESVAARVPLGDDALFVTPTRTLVYRADGLLSDESVEEFPHGAERIDVSVGRRKATLSLDYGLDGDRSFTVPAKALDRALHPVLAGTLNAVGVTDPGETVKETFRFSELTLVVTSDRIVKHVGAPVWDEEYEEFHFGDVTDLAVEDGTVATTIVVTHDGRRERFKAPTDRAREVRERLAEALLAYHDVDSVEALRERFAPEDEETTSATMSFGEGPTPLSVDRDDDDAADPTGPTATGADPVETTQATGDAAESGGERDGAATEAARGEADPTEAERGGSPAGDASPAADRVDVVGADAAAAPDDDGAPATGDGAGTGESEGATGGGSGGFESLGTGDLLGPPDDAEEDRDTGSTDPAAAESGTDEELAALTAEVAALRETVEAQNDRIARQEELLERLVVELRERL